MNNPFRYFNSSPEVIRLAVMMYMRYPLSLRQVEDMLFERGIDVSHETIRYWWNRFGQNEIVCLQRDDLSRRVPINALARFGARYQFPTAELDGFC